MAKNFARISNDSCKAWFRGDTLHGAGQYEGMIVAQDRLYRF